MFAREPFSGAAKAGVNFIENQKRAMFVAKFSEQGQKFFWRNIDAAARLNWFNENGTDTFAPEEVADLKFDGRKIGSFFGERREVSELAQLRLKWAAEMLAVRGVERAVAEAVIRAGESNDAAFLSCKDYRFERGFNGFKTGVGENS